MANPQIRIIDLPTTADITATVATEFVPIESTANGGRRITVTNFLTTGGSAIFVPRIVSTDRAIATFSGVAGAVQNNPNATIDAGGNLTATGLNTASSLKYKENVISLFGGLATIERLRAVRYTQKDAIIPGDWKIGLIAEEVNLVLPEVVKLGDDGKPDALDYSRIVAVLIDAVKELASRVKTLENRS